MALTKMTLGEALVKAGLDGAVAWIQVPGNYERLSPAVQALIERGVKAWEAQVEEVEEAPVEVVEEVVPSSGGHS